MRIQRVAIAIALSMVSASAPSLAYGPSWRRDVWWDVGTPGSQYHLASAIWLDGQDRVHVAYNATSGSLPVSHMMFDAGLDFLYLDGPLGGLCGDNSVTGDRTTGDTALLSTDEMQVTLIDATGQQKWRSRAFPGTGAFPGPSGAGIVMHPSGDFIAVGGDGTTTVYAARFLRSDGSIVWSVSYGSLDLDTVQGGIALDPAGNVIVANHSRGVPPQLPVLFRLDGASGAMSSPVTLTPGCIGAVSYADVDAIATDAAGNVFLAGEVAFAGSISHGWVMKASPAFAPLWCTTQDDGTPYRERWNSIAIDGAGRIAATGVQDTASGYDLLTALLDANGGTLWSRTYDPAGTTEQGASVAFDSAGRVVVGGGWGGFPPLILLKYDLAGTLLDFTNWYAASPSRTYGAAVDGAGNIVVAGDNGGKVAVHKMSPTGARLWSRFGTRTNETIYRVKTDGAGNIYLAGQDTNYAWLVQKRDPAGNLVWERSGTYPVLASSLDFTPSGNIVVLGRGGQIVEYSPSGGVARAGSLAIGGGDNPAVEVHANGEISAAGTALVHASSTFAQLWRNDNPLGTAGVVDALALDSQGDIYAAGFISGYVSTLSRVDGGTGALVWARAVPSVYPSNLAGIAVDGSGNVLAVGIDAGKNRIVRYHASGALLYDGRYAFPGTYTTGVTDVVLNTAGNQATLAINFDRSSEPAASVVSFTLDPTSPVGPRRITTGEGPGIANSNVVRMFDPSGAASGSFAAYGAGKFGTNVATGNVNGAAGDEQLTGPGPGDVYGPQVRAFTGSGTSIGKVNFYAYGTLKYGVIVGAAGLDGDAPREIVTGPGPGPVFGPQVRGWNFDGTALTAIQKVNFYAYGTLKYGVNVASRGDVDGDGFDEMLTGPGPGGSFGPQVRGFNYDDSSVAAMGKISFNAFPSGTHGANVAASDLEPDTFDEILAGRGPAPGLAAEVATFDFDGSTVAPKGPAIVIDAVTRYGANVGGGDLEGDGNGELLAGVGDDPTGPARVRGFRFVGSTYLSVPSTDFVAYTPSTYGVNVAMGDLM